MNQIIDYEWLFGNAYNVDVFYMKNIIMITS